MVVAIRTNSRDDDRRRIERPRRDNARTSGEERSHRRGDEHSSERSRCDSHEAGAVRHLCDRRPSSEGSVTRALYWDTGDPYHYVRLQTEDGYDVLIVGGEDHKTGQANDGFERYGRLEQWTRARFPQMLEVEFRWSGQVMEPVDGPAFIGRNPWTRTTSTSQPVIRDKA